MAMVGKLTRANGLLIAAQAAALVSLGASAIDAQVPSGNRAPPLLVPPANQPASRQPQPASVIVAAPAPTAAAAPSPAPSLPPSSNTSSVPESFTPSDEFQQWITALAREHLPDKYEKKKNWGHTTKVWDGLKLRLEDGRLETKRRWKQANDGTWYKYRVDVVEPEKHFDIRIANIREIGGGKITSDVQVVARLQCFGRMSQWEHGVQLVSLSADAETLVALTAQVDLALRLDASELPPAVLLVPEVRTARVDILDFRLQRVSNARGPLVKSLSSSVREIVEDKLAEQNRGKLAEKLNKQIAKQQDKLRLSLAEVAKSPWGALLPKDAAAPEN